MKRGNLKLGYFVYKNVVYKSGTKVIFNGECKTNGKKTFLNNQCCSFLYTYGDSYFQSNDMVYSCDISNFIKNITIIPEYTLSQDKTEVLFTDEMVIYTIWYIIIMTVGVILTERITLWIFATIIYAKYIYDNKN